MNILMDVDAYNCTGHPHKGSLSEANLWQGQCSDVTEDSSKESCSKVEPLEHECHRVP